MKEKNGSMALTEFVRMFRANHRNDSDRKRRFLIRFCLINNMSDACSAFTFMRRL